jgi:required for meiotic nuclear division protein 1
MLAKVYAWQVAETIDIKAFKSSFTAAIYHADADELFYELENKKYLYVFKYGVVCFLNHTETDMSAFIKLVQPHCRNMLSTMLSDTFDIETNANRINFGFNKVDLVKADTDMYRLVMLNLSQSVALDYYAQQTNLLLEETNHYTQLLEQKGSIRLSGTSLKKLIGRTLNLKNRIAENLYIFDSPEETWEDEDLSRLDTGLKKTFDLQARFRDIQEGLQIVKENLELFKDLLQNRNSTALEWIIIILILVEVINLLLEKIF